MNDAAKVVAQRTIAISSIAGTGGMVSIPWPVERVLSLIERWDGSISVAAHNGPSSTVVTGPAAAMDELITELERDDVAADTDPRRLRLPLRSHRGVADRTARRRCRVCSREPVTSPSSPRSPARASTCRSSTATTGSPIFANRCCSSRRFDGHTNAAIPHSSNAVHTRCSPPVFSSRWTIQCRSRSIPGSSPRPCPGVLQTRAIPPSRGSDSTKSL